MQVMWTCAQKETTMRVLLADGDADVRWALRLLLIHELGKQVVGEATNAEDLWMQAKATSPDLLVLDWGLCGAAASAALARLRTLDSHLQIIVISGQPEARTPALVAGADAFVCKADPPEHMVQALRAVHARRGRPPER